jgi:hypothetical protein
MANDSVMSRGSEDSLADIGIRSTSSEEDDYSESMSDHESDDKEDDEVL